MQHYQYQTHIHTNINIDCISMILILVFEMILILISLAPAPSLPQHGRISCSTPALATIFGHGELPPGPLKYPQAKRFCEIKQLLDPIRNSQTIIKIEHFEVKIE